ncbi:EP300-interacting inhibitor of differentiation 3 [Topomyia yanbarensis]|uniref:EP300-interacting inhibitor of differentiation 3 n=1 Tax=Topomyia yanbarensis TaxID=2498891 RepID=UPI00273BB1D8|nr:EP300-interacting inhibitor of differentiation 3 [Topomyia yanbarensis]
MDLEEIQTKMQRSLRKQKYKQLLEEGAQLGLRAETADPVETFQAVTNILEASNALQNEGRIKDRAENATEVLMDAQVLKMSHDVVHAAMQKMGNSEFSDDELVAVILSQFDTEQGVENWDKITREAASVFRMTKHSQSLYGAFEPEPVVVQKEARQRAQRQKTNFGQALKPETVDKLQKKEKSAQKLNLIFNQIVHIYERRQTPIPYYELIIDPEDFMNTVDNAFQISFLIRDGRVALLNDDDHEPVVRPTTQKENEQAQRMNETTQAILGLNPRKWRDMVERFGISEAMLLLNREELDATQSQV